METLTCPELLSNGQRCNAIAEIKERNWIASTAGPVEHLRTLCLNKHVLYCSIDMFYKSPRDELEAFLASLVTPESDT